MTHSLHRTGTPESLREDYVVLVTPAVGINNQGSQDKLREILDFIFELGPTNIGSYETGTIFSGATIEEIKAKLSETPRVRVCFSSKEKVKRLIQFIKERDYGLSVTVSGLIDEIQDMANELGIKPHSVNLSLGVHGKVEDLPSPEVLEFVTMCGHGMISASLVEKLIEGVKEGRYTPEKAAEEMARPCVCGIFNTERAAKLLAKYVQK
jgi:DNA polymerase elongation subunit (family B)